MRNDYKISAIAGFFTGVFILPLLYNLEIVFPFGIPKPSVIIIIPFLWMAGILLGNILSRWLPVMRQFSRYVASGFLSFAIDFGIFNLLFIIWISYSVFLGLEFSKTVALFKGISYVVANLNAYLWNKYWVFRNYNPANGISMQSVLSEYGRFLIVSLIGFMINVSITYVVVNNVSPQFGLGNKAWANIAAVAATAVVIIWNFAGYKLFVFRKKGV